MMAYVGLAISIFAGLLLYSAVAIFVCYKVMFNEKFMVKMTKKYVKFAEDLEDLYYDED